MCAGMCATGVAGMGTRLEHCRRSSWAGPFGQLRCRLFVACSEGFDMEFAEFVAYKEHESSRTKWAGVHDTPQPASGMAEGPAAMCACAQMAQEL